MIERLLRAFGVSDESAPWPVVPSPPAPAERATPSLAREALLCSIDPSSGKPRPGADYAIATALLLDLAHAGRLDVTGSGKKTRTTVRDTRPFGNDELDRALTRLAAGGPDQKLTRYVPLLPGADHLATHLVAEGILVEHATRRFGVATRRLEPTAAAGRDEVVARVRSALLGESVPDLRTTSLVCVFQFGIPFKLVVAKDRVKEANRRSDELCEQLSVTDRALLSAVLAVQDRNSGDYSSGV